jgi:hypothetical protein
MCIPLPIHSRANTNWMQTLPNSLQEDLPDFSYNRTSIIQGEERVDPQYVGSWNTSVVRGAERQ